MWKKPLRAASHQESDKLVETLLEPSPPPVLGLGKSGTPDLPVAPASGAQAPQRPKCLPQGPSRHQPDPLPHSHDSSLSPTCLPHGWLHFLSGWLTKKMQPTLVLPGHTD